MSDLLNHLFTQSFFKRPPVVKIKFHLFDQVDT